MKKLIILGLVLLMVGVFATTVFGKAEKSDLIEGPDNSGNQNPSGEVVGFAIINNPDPIEEVYNLTVVVSIKKCAPNFKYSVYLERYAPGPIYNLIGELTTNEVGNGTVEINLDTNYLSRSFGAGEHKLQIVVSIGGAWTFVNTAVDIVIK